MTPMPWDRQKGRIDASTAFQRGSVPVRRWMAGQIERAGNRSTMLLFLSRHPSAPRDVRSYDEVPLETLLPAFLVSELETAFAIGVRFLVPFLCNFEGWAIFLDGDMIVRDDIAKLWKMRDPWTGVQVVQHNYKSLVQLL